MASHYLDSENLHGLGQVRTLRGVSDPPTRVPPADDVAAQASAIETQPGVTTRSGSSGSADPERLERGSAVGRYLVLESIGIGGMGVVYAGYDPELDRKVAIKVVRKQLAGGSEGTRRLLEEAKAMARLKHTNVVKVHDVGTVGGNVFVAMEYIDGQTMRAYLDSVRAQAPRRWREALALMLEAGRGLAAAHAKALVHGDFKPDNIMIEKTGRVLVMDFGLAVADSDHPDWDERPGTPAYMAPEQHAGKPGDAQSDQFSYCVALYELLYGGRPFAGDSRETAAASIIAGTLQPEPKGHRIPRWIRRALLRGLSHDPKDRWPSIAHLLRALRDDPGRRRRPMIIAALSVLAVSTAVLGVLGFRQIHARQQAARCIEEGREIETVWNEQARARLLETFERGGGARGVESHERVSAWLDDWTGSWSAAKASVCSREVEAAMEPVAKRRAQACFDEQRDRLMALLDVHFEGSGTIAGAVQSASALTLLDSCDDERALARRPMPPNVEIEARLRPVRRRLVRAEALQLGGDLQGAVEEAESALREAEGLHWPPIAAEARMRMATVEAELGHYDGARTQLERAFREASGGGADHLAAQIATRLLRVVGYHEVRTREAKAWGEVAGSLLTHVQAEQTLDAAQLANDRGLMHAAVGELDDAERWHREALSLRSRLLGAEHPENGHSLGNLGTIAAARGDFKAALDWHARALVVRESGLGAAHPDAGRSHSHLGRVNLELGQTAAALDHLRRALDIFEPSLGAQHRATGRAIQYLADAYRAEGRVDEALEHYRRAYDIRLRTMGADHPETAASAQALGELLAKRGRTNEALPFLQSALSVRTSVLGRDHADSVASRRALAELCGGGLVAACDEP